jgi:hypothetical protein
MKTPNAEHAEVPERKVTHYLLSPESEEGRGKAMFFNARGFSSKQWRMLAIALRAHVRSHNYVQVRRTRWGERYVVDGPLECPDGESANIRSIWNIKPPATHPRLVTAHPLPRT